jgi:hypothetical protein
MRELHIKWERRAYSQTEKSFGKIDLQQISLNSRTPGEFCFIDTKIGVAYRFCH